MKISLILWLSISLISQLAAADNTLPLLPKILATEEHNPAWFTQGFYRDNNGFFISSGLYQQSQLIYQTPQQLRRYSLPDKYFAEGLTVIEDKLYLLTWKENSLFIFDKNTFQLLNTISYQGEGWGLTDNGHELIMSNGSNTLSFRNKDTLNITRTLTIQQFNHINELEYVNGIIWANRWYDDNIYGIDSQSGCVLATINLLSLRQKATQPDNVNIANGIAYDAEQNGLWVTGKYWQKRFLIALPAIKSDNKSGTCQSQ